MAYPGNWQFECDWGSRWNGRKLSWTGRMKLDLERFYHSEMKTWECILKTITSVSRFISTRVFEKYNTVLKSATLKVKSIYDMALLSKPPPTNITVAFI